PFRAIYIIKSKSNPIRLLSKHHVLPAMIAASSPDSSPCRYPRRRFLFALPENLSETSFVMNLLLLCCTIPWFLNDFGRERRRLPRAEKGKTRTIVHILLSSFERPGSLNRSICLFISLHPAPLSSIPPDHPDMPPTGDAYNTD